MLDFSRLPAIYEPQYPTQEAFAETLGVSQSYVSMLTRNERKASTRLLEKMARCLGMSLVGLVTALQENITESFEKGLTA